MSDCDGSSSRDSFRTQPHCGKRDPSGRRSWATYSRQVCSLFSLAPNSDWFCGQSSTATKHYRWWLPELRACPVAPFNGASHSPWLGISHGCCTTLRIVTAVLPGPEAVRHANEKGERFPAPPGSLPGAARQEFGTTAARHRTRREGPPFRSCSLRSCKSQSRPAGLRRPDRRTCPSHWHRQQWLCSDPARRSAP